MADYLCRPTTWQVDCVLHAQPALDMLLAALTRATVSDLCIGLRCCCRVQVCCWMMSVCRCSASCAPGPHTLRPCCTSPARQCQLTALRQQGQRDVIWVTPGLETATQRLGVLAVVVCNGAVQILLCWDTTGSLVLQFARHGPPANGSIALAPHEGWQLVLGEQLRAVQQGPLLLTSEASSAVAEERWWSHATSAEPVHHLQFAVAAGSCGAQL